MRFRWLAVLALTSGFSVPAHATMSWTNWWPDFTAGDPGSAQSWDGDTEIFYSGTLMDVRYDVSWLPTATYDVGVPMPPMPYQGALMLPGGSYTLNTITFSRPIHKPYLAIWSLGQEGLPAALYFTETPADPDTGGPSWEFGGNAIWRDGNIIWGEEGNGVIHFSGLYTSISWISPFDDPIYGFTVGIRYRQIPCGPIDPEGEEPGGPPGCVEPPEPLTASVFGSALIGLASLTRRRRHGD